MTRRPTTSMTMAAALFVSLASPALAPFATSYAVAKAPAEQLADVTAGAYSLEKNHAFLTVSVGHNGGISDYRMDFKDFDASMDFNPSDPKASSIEMSVNPLSIETHYPGDYMKGHSHTGFKNWNEDLARNAKWLNADKFPKMTFKSSGIEMTGPNTGKVTGDLSLLGASKQVTFDVTFRGVANVPWFGDRDLIGFDAETTIKRSDFGMAALIPSVSDEVTVSFTGEFLKDK
ncbi:MAG: YceI family protein [Pseudomonadota bacterium]